MAKNHEISVYFSTNAIFQYVTHLHNFEIQKAMLLVPLMPDELKTFSGSLVLDLRIWWCHMHTLYSNNWRGEHKTMLSDDLGEKKIVAKRP